MIRKWEIRLIILVFPVLIFSCSEYKKVINSTDLEYKYQKTVEYYEEKDYVKAYPLIEELIGVFRGTAKAEKLFYMHAYTDYYLKDYILASHRFKQFYKTFPNSQRAEECQYMGAYCYYLTSPKYSLDQTNTYQAISELQMFATRYPASGRLDSTNLLIDNLRGKLEKKSFESSRLYYKTGYYESAILSFENTLKDFPGTDTKEEINFYILKSHYELSINSVKKKKKERFDKASEAYRKFVDNFPQSKYLKEAENIFDNIQKEQEKLL